VRNGYKAVSDSLVEEDYETTCAWMDGSLGNLWNIVAWEEITGLSFSPEGVGSMGGIGGQMNEEKEDSFRKNGLV
jgi:histidyl-tRNA synthetase